MHEKMKADDSVNCMIVNLGLSCISMRNTFTWEFAGCNNDYMKWFYIFTNPPYGGDKISKNAEQIKRDKIISKIKSSGMVIKP